MCTADKPQGSATDADVVTINTIDSGVGPVANPADDQSESALGDDADPTIEVDVGCLFFS
jgi:hypothetical protein